MVQNPVHIICGFESINIIIKIFDDSEWPRVRKNEGGFYVLNSFDGACANEMK